MNTLVLLTGLFSISSSTVDIIFDCDFGGPIDDTFALSYLLRKQSYDNTFNIRLITTVGRNTTARATILAKYLSLTGYSNLVDIGIGESDVCGNFFSIGCVGPAWPWMYQFNNYTLSDYEGVVYENGVERIIEIIDEYNKTNPIYVVTVGALTNLATVFSARPDLKENIRMFTMSGSLFDDTDPWGYFAEFNILDDVGSAQVVYNDRDIDPYYTNLCAVPWDTGYYFQIEGDQYQRLLDAMSDNLLVKYAVEMYEIWYPNGGYAFDSGRIFHPRNASASMYDLEMVWLAAYVAGLEMEEQHKTCENVSYLVMGAFDVEVNDTGHIYAHDEEMPDVYFAMDWREPNGLIDIATEIVDVLLTSDPTTTTETPTRDTPSPIDLGDTGHHFDRMISVIFIFIFFIFIS